MSYAKDEGSVILICDELSRDPDDHRSGRMVPCPERFPSGMARVSQARLRAETYQWTSVASKIDLCPSHTELFES